MLETILNSTNQTTLLLGDVLTSTVASLILGIFIAYLYMYKNTYSKNFVATLALLPAMMQIIIMLVSGNLGTGLAVLGAFGLVRFRSAPGSARDIASIFLCMAVGLATGMGYIILAFLFLFIIGGMTFILYNTNFGEAKQVEKLLKITIPENLDYEGIFDDLFIQYTDSAELIQVRTTNMGSLYELNYHIKLKGLVVSKEFMDQLRCRNGNLNILCGRVTTSRNEL